MSRAGNSPIRWRRMAAFARKEFLHILHDPRSLVILFVLPTIQLIMFGYALNLEIQKVTLAVADLDNTPESRALVEHFRGSRIFTVIQGSVDEKAIHKLFLRRQARATLLIQKGFARTYRSQPVTRVQVVVDATDPNAATLIQNYINEIILQFNREAGAYLPPPFRIAPTIWFNPELKSSYFFVPGLLALLLIMISALLTSITVTREKETGTMEQILVSPVQPLEIIAGKLSPYVLLAFLDAGLILLIGVGIFKVPFVGNPLLLIAYSLLYVITGLSLGLLFSTIAPTQQVAMMMALTATLLPTIMLSGFIFPIPSMPRVLQWISHLIPARYFLPMVRGVMLKGNTADQLIMPTVVLVLMAVLLLALARGKFKTDLEA